MKKVFSETELAVDAWLLEKKITFKISGGMATKRDDWECDAWMYELWRPSAEERNGKRIEEKYYTGTGHRQLTHIGKKWMSMAPKTDLWKRRQIEKQHSVAVAPHVTGILASLLSDANGAEQNFHDWCSDFGADTDSIKAQNMYNACCEILTKVRMFFTLAERVELQALLEDY